MKESELLGVFSTEEKSFLDCHGPIQFSQSVLSALKKLNLATVLAPACCRCEICGEGCQPLYANDTCELPFEGFKVKCSVKAIRRVQVLLLGCERGAWSLLKKYCQDALTIVDGLYVPLQVLLNRPLWESVLGPSVRATFLYWFLQLVSGNWIKELKYQLNWMFVDSERRCGEEELEYPERDSVVIGEDGVIGYGIIQVKYKLLSRTKVTKDRNRIFRNTVLQGIKRGMPSVSADFVLAAAQKHKATLSKSKQTPDDLLNFMEEEIIKMIPQFEDDYSKVGDSISHKSCTEKNLGKLGALSECYESYFEETDEKNRVLNKIVTHSVLSFDFLLGMTYHPVTGTREDRYRFHNGWVRGYCHELSLEEGYQPGKTYVKFILEPLKCRTITKAPAFVNGIYKPLQQHMWSNLRKKWQFSLIGEPVGIEHVRQLEEETGFCYPDDQEDQLLWVSGDYSAATDNMHMDVTQCLLDAIMRNDHVFRWCMKRALVGNTISYENCFKGFDKDTVLPEDFKQTNGQLMGCIFSFPLLCMANYLVYKYTLKQVYGVNSLVYKKTPVLVNGDDILFKATKEFISRWERNIQLVGFQKSLGKNFVARSFCTINSQYFHFDVKTKMYEGEIVPTYRCRSIPYINNGFIFNMKKGTDTDDLSDRASTNDRLYCLGFSDYLKNWLGIGNRGYIDRLMQTLLHHRRDIGWSGRSLYDLGLSNKGDNPAILAFSKQIAIEKSIGIKGDSSQTRGSNKIFSLWGDNQFPNIKCLKNKVLKSFYKVKDGKEISVPGSKVRYLQSILLSGERKKASDLETRNGKGMGGGGSSILGHCIFYNARGNGGFFKGVTLSKIEA